TQTDVSVGHYRAIFPKLIMNTGIEVIPLRAYIRIHAQNTDIARTERDIQKLTINKHVLTESPGNGSTKRAVSTDATDNADLTCCLDLSLFDVLSKRHPRDQKQSHDGDKTYCS